MQIVLGECSNLPVRLRAGIAAVGALGHRDHFIQTDGRLEHEQNIEAVLANVLHHPCNLLALDYGFVDGLAELLNEFAETRCHKYLPVRPKYDRNAGSGFESIYLTAISGEEQPGRRMRSGPLLPS